MASFLSESYLKPKLIESRVINRIIEDQNNKITFESKAISYIKIFLYKYWKIIIILLVIIGLFYWRYKEIKNIRQKDNKYNNKYKENNKVYKEDESDSETSSVSE